MADEYIGRHVLSINELSSLARLLESANNFVVDWESEPMQVGLIAINVHDQRGFHVGAITKWTKSEEVKFEPNFKVEL